MDFKLPPEVEALRVRVAAFVRERMAPTAQRDEIFRPIRPALHAQFHMMDFQEVR